MPVQHVRNSNNLPTIFLIPGAWHGPWVYDGVRSVFSDRGYETESVALASVGTNDASIGLFDDAAKVRSALLELIEAGKEVVIIAHSYAGVVASNAVHGGLGRDQRAAEGKPGGIVILLYLCAFFIPVGSSLLMANKGQYFDWWIIQDGFVTPNKDSVNLFYNDVEPSLAAKAAAALHPISLQVAHDKTAYAPADEGIEMGYIFAENDQSLDLSVQRAMFSAFPAGSFSASLESGHSPFFSMPVPLVDTVQEAIKYVRTEKSITRESVKAKI